MKKLASTLPNMVAVLTITTLLAGFMLGYVNSLTADAREKADSDKREAALRSVIGTFENDPSADADEVEHAPGNTVTIYPAIIDGSLAAGAVEVTNSNGFSGDITIIVGFDRQGNILGYEVTQHAETPGLGAKMAEWFRQDGSRGIIGRNASLTPLRVSKDGGNVDAITAATITSRAFLDAVNTASKGWQTYLNRQNRQQ